MKIIFSSKILSSSITIRHSVPSTGLINYFNYPSVNEGMIDRIYE